MSTILEQLPDEILLIVCQYLSQYQIIKSFLGLNYRLNCTISHFLQSLVLSRDDGLNHRQSRELLSTIGSYLHSLTIKDSQLSSAEISLASNIKELTFIHTRPDSIPVIFQQN
jgi:hypothetical protein